MYILYLFLLNGLVKVCQEKKQSNVLHNKH